MRPLLILAALSLALAGPAAGQEKSRFVFVKPAPKAQTGLRGRVSMSAPKPVAEPLAPAGPQAPGDPQAPEPVGAAASVTWRAPPDRGAARQCRSGCDRTYYFCLSSGDGDACPTSWSQCRTKCEARKG